MAQVAGATAKSAHSAPRGYLPVRCQKAPFGCTQWHQGILAACEYLVKPRAGCAWLRATLAAPSLYCPQSPVAAESGAPMSDADKSKRQLLHELKEMRVRVSELESLKKQRERTGEALGRSEEPFRKIFENSNDGIFVVDPDRDEIIDCQL